MRRRIKKQRIRGPVRKKRIGTGRKTIEEWRELVGDSVPDFLQKLENKGKTDRVRVHALRRQCKADGRLRMIKCWLVRDKDRNGEWIIRLEGGITGREFLRARKHCGDSFFTLRLRGWEVHQGKLSEDPRWDYFWISGREIADALMDFGWL